MRRLIPSLAIAALLVTACNSADGPAERVSTKGSPAISSSAAPSGSPSMTAHRASRRGLLPGMPPPLSPHDIYAADRPGLLSPVVRHDPALVYVPNSESGTLDVIDQRTFQIVGHYQVGRLPQHVTPSYDMRTLYVLNDQGNSLTVIDPRTGKPGRTIPVTDPYNMYFTPDGRYAIVVAEALQRLDFRDAHTMRLVKSLPVDCRGIDHADFTADGRYAIFSCEFSGKLLKLDVVRQRVVGMIHVKEGGSPQDVKTSPDGKVMYVADQYANGVQIIDPKSFKEIGFLHTGVGAHGLYVNRESTWMYVTNRREGSISIIDLRTRTVIHKWWIPGGGSPDMGGLSADGKVLWLSGRYSSVVYALNAHTGQLLARIPVGSSPHGLCVYPQPGRYSLGHTGVFR
jgi:DNA-binding beta-propeller fold protein YncE/predicted small secreted protein